MTQWLSHSQFSRIIVSLTTNFIVENTQNLTVKRGVFCYIPIVCDTYSKVYFSRDTMAEITEFNIGQGETFKVLATVENADTGGYLDITDYTFTGQVRENFTTEEIAATFTVTKISPQSSGSFYIELSPGQTVTFDQRKYVYDINMTSGSITRRVLEGYFVVRPTATR